MVHWPPFFLVVAIFLLKTELDFPVLIPGDMRVDATPFKAASIFGVRVAQSSSVLSESGGYSVDIPFPSTKFHEVWAFGGYDLIFARPRILPIKRVYQRACYRALRYGMAEYRGKMLLPTDVPWRFRESFRQLPVAPGIRCMTWNASKALVYDELLIWVSTQPFWPYKRRDGASRLHGAPPNGTAHIRLANRPPFC